MRGPLDVHRRLLGDDVPHEIVQLPRRITIAAELPDALGVPASACAIAHLVVADGRPHVLVLAAGSTWSARRVVRALRVRSVRRADAAETSAATEFTSGLVSPVGLPDGLPVLVDAEVARGDVVYTAVGETTTALKIRGRDLLTAAAATVDAIAEPPPEPAPAGTVDPRLVARFAVPAL